MFRNAIGSDIGHTSAALAERVLRACALCLLLAAPTALIGGCRSDARRPAATHSRLLMGTLFEITVTGRDTARFAAMAERAFAEVARIEALTTDYDSASAVEALNRGDERVSVGPELAGLLQRSDELRTSTGGAFDIHTGEATTLWREAERLGRAPADDELARACGRSQGFGEASDPTDGLRRYRIDLGGIAKGYAVDRALDVIRQGGAEGALINGGGDMAAFGLSPRGTPWRIGVRHPRRTSGEYFGVITLNGSAVATSGDYERGYTIGDSTYCHILDPRTAGPATASVSATVLAPTAELADALSTAAFVLGPDSAIAMLERMPEVEGLVIAERAGTLTGRATSGFRMEIGPDSSGIHITRGPEAAR